MRKIVLTLSFSLFIYTLFAQHESVLRNFKYRINHFRAININLNASGQFDQTDLPAGKNKNSSSGANAGAAYSFTRSTDRILLNTLTLISGGYNSSKSDNSSSEFVNRGHDVFMNHYFLNKWFTKKNFFTELGADAATGYQWSKTSNSTPAYAKNDRLNPYLAIYLGIGKGRLENITDMQNALWLYKTLTAENKLSRSLTDVELDGLGRTVTRANNTRILDSRKRTQFILETIDAYFQKNGLISSTDIRYFSSLNDIVFFAFNSPRFSGTEKFIRLSPSINYTSANTNQSPAGIKSEDRVITRIAALSAGISKYHPVNLKHQNNMGASITGRYISHDFTEKFYLSQALSSRLDFSSTMKQAVLNIFFEHAVYPNTRTIMSARLNSETGYQEIGGESNFFGRADLTGTLNYFISYRTRLTCSAGVIYRKNYYNIYQYLELYPDNIQFFANAGVAISI